MKINEFLAEINVSESISDLEAFGTSAEWRIWEKVQRNPEYIGKNIKSGKKAVWEY